MEFTRDELRILERALRAYQSVCIDEFEPVDNVAVKIGIIRSKLNLLNSRAVISTRQSLAPTR